MQKRCARLVRGQQITHRQHGDIGSGGGAFVHIGRCRGSAVATPTLQGGINAFEEDQALTFTIYG